MKCNAVFGAGLGVMLMAAVATGAVNPKEDKNPSRAGQSLIYFYDVAASETHGAGKLQIDLEKRTFVFNGQGFTPSAMIELRARAAASTEYVVFASGKATPSGNLHIAGTWEADATPVGVVAGYAVVDGLVVLRACLKSRVKACPGG